jgi:hypothetical protein
MLRGGCQEQVNLIILKKNLLADNSIFGHYFKVLSGNDVPVSSSSHKDISARRSIFHSRNFIASHRCLKRIDGVDFRN